MSDGSKSLIVRDLGKRYQSGRKHEFELWALKDVSFELERGTILGVIGPNGAGKTTLLKVLARVTPPTTGSVTGWGRVVPLLALGAGFQAEMSGRENVFLNAAMYGIAREEVERRMEAIIEFAGLEKFIDTPVKRYSSGMYVRLAFSVAINMAPDILLADEVLAVGDLEFQEACLRRVEEGGRDGMTVLFVSHDMDAITRLCHRVLWLNAGGIVRIGDPHDVVAEYQASAWTSLNRRRQTKKGTGHLCEAGELLFVRLTSGNGKEVGALRVGDEAWVEVGYKTTLPGLQVRAQIDVATAGSAAFRSVQPDPPRLAEPGAAIARARIPAHLLNETTYSVSASLAFFGGDKAHTCLLDHALTFRVYDQLDGASARGKYTGRMPGAVAPRLEWVTELPQLPGAAPAPALAAREESIK